MLRKSVLSFMMGAALLGAGLSDAQAQKSSDTLRIAMRDALTNVDPYYNNLRTGVVMSHQAWDMLVYRDPDTFAIKPLLASSWTMVDDKTIDFQLRSGVTFHDGSPLGADDVVYTINLVSSADSKVSVPTNTNWIEKAEKTETDTEIKAQLALLKAAADRGDHAVQAQAPRGSRGFFERQGFVAQGEPFEVDGVVCTTLRHELPKP
jgi:peptide/nickel transport system substrate-binding protein